MFRHICSNTFFVRKSNAKIKSRKKFMEIDICVFRNCFGLMMHRRRALPQQKNPMWPHKKKIVNQKTVCLTFILCFFSTKKKNRMKKRNAFCEFGFVSETKLCIKITIQLVTVKKTCFFMYFVLSSSFRRWIAREFARLRSVLGQTVENHIKVEIQALKKVNLGSKFLLAKGRILNAG